MNELNQMLKAIQTTRSIYKQELLDCNDTDKKKEYEQKIIELTIEEKNILKSIEKKEGEIL